MAVIGLSDVVQPVVDVRPGFEVGLVVAGQVFLPFFQVRGAQQVGRGEDDGGSSWLERREDAGVLDFAADAQVSGGDVGQGGLLGG